MYKRKWLTCGVLFIAVTAFLPDNMSKKSFLEKIPFINRVIEQKVSEKIAEVKPDKSIDQEIKAVKEMYANLSTIQRMIVENNQRKDSPEQVYSNIWIAYTCVEMIATGVSGLPFGLFKAGTDDPIENNDILKMLKGKVSATMTGREFIQRLSMGLSIRGNGYARVQVGKSGKLYEAMPLLPQYVHPVTSDNDRDVILYYRFSQYGGDVRIPVEEVIHAKRLSAVSTVEGYSPLSAGGALTEFATKQADYKNNLYDNQVKPVGVISSPLEMDDKTHAQFKKNLDRCRGPENAGKELTLTHGATWQAMSYTPQDLELLQSESMTWGMIVTLYGLPVELFGNLAKQKNYANMREATRHMYLFALIPNGEMIFSALSMFFFPNMDYEFRILVDNIPALRPTTEELGGQYWLTPGEKRTQMGHKLPEDQEKQDQLDKLYFPNSLTPAEDLGTETIFEKPETL